MNGTILLLVGKSGSGKTTIAKVFEQNGYSVLQSYTTRPKRHSKEVGHTFITRQDFWKLDHKQIVAFTVFDNEIYCATQEQVENADIYIIDTSGIEYFKKHYHGQKHIKVVYLKVPVYTRFYRMLKRGDGILKSITRILHDAKAFRKVSADITVSKLSVSDTIINNKEAI